MRGSPSQAPRRNFTRVIPPPTHAQAAHHTCPSHQLQLLGGSPRPIGLPQQLSQKPRRETPTAASTQQRATDRSCFISLPVELPRSESVDRQRAATPPPPPRLSSERPVGSRRRHRCLRRGAALSTDALAARPLRSTRSRCLCARRLPVLRGKGSDAALLVLVPSSHLGVAAGSATSQQWLPCDRASESIIAGGWPLSPGLSLGCI
jgi:hypothetical protein